MTAKKSLEQILIIVGAGCILGLITWAVVTLVSTDKVQSSNSEKIIILQKDIENLKKIKDSLHSMDKTLALQSKDMDTIKRDFKDLKILIQNKYTESMEKRKARIRTELENNKIAFDY